MTGQVCRLSTMQRLPVIDNSEYFNHAHTMSNDSEFKTNDITVYYHPSLDGGGTDFGRRYVPVLKNIYKNKKFNSCFEWCSGPGFIGFDILSSGVCDQLYLADIYGPAMDAVSQTIDGLPAHYQNKVHRAKIKGIKDLPKDWKFDLVVSNPPHWNPPAIKTMITELRWCPDRIGDDLGWQIHKEFFDNIGPHLNDDAVILLQEQSYASGPEMFKSMIEDAGLTITECYWEPTNDAFYYLEVKKK